MYVYVCVCYLGGIDGSVVQRHCHLRTLCHLHACMHAQAHVIETYVSGLCFDYASMFG